MKSTKIAKGLSALFLRLSVVRLLALKPYWLSGRLSSVMVVTGLLSSNLASSLLAIERSVMPPVVGTVRLSTYVAVQGYVYRLLS